MSLAKILCLRPSEGWQFNPFDEGNNNSFYSYMAETNELCIAWVAVRDTITEADLQKHHFIRRENLGTGENNFNPRLLIVTDKKVWFVSRIGSQKFSRATPATIIMLMVDNLKKVLAHYKKEGIYSLGINKLHTTIEKQRNRVRMIGEQEVEKQLSFEDRLFDTAKPIENAEPDYKAMHEVALMRQKALERIVKMKTTEAQDMSIMLHYMLCNTFNETQLRVIQSFTEEYIYINPWYNKNKLLVKVSNENIFGIGERMGSINNRFYIVDPAGDIETIYIEPENVLTELNPGFLRLDKALLKNLINK